MCNKSPFIALHIEEGEIPVADITPEVEEMEECGEQDPSTLPNASIKRLENALIGSSSPCGSWVDIVKKSRPNLRVESPGQSSSQGSEDILKE